MKAYTYSYGELSVGIALTPDPKLGQIITLGEGSKARRYEIVPLGWYNPAEIVSDGRVNEAEPVKIALSIKDGKPEDEKSFFVLGKPESDTVDVLVYIDTFTSYIKNCRGYWNVVTGRPENIVSVLSASIPDTWDDGLVVMHPGDVLQVYPSMGSPDALWVSTDGTIRVDSWRDYEKLQ